MTTELGDIRQQLGKLMGLVEGFDERMRERHDTANQQAAELRSELRNVKHEQRNIDQGMLGQVELLKREVEALELKVGGLGPRIESVASDVGDLRAQVTVMARPIAQFVSMRNKVSSAVMVLLTLTSVIWFVAEPAWKFIVEKFMAGMMPSR